MPLSIQSLLVYTEIMKRRWHYALLLTGVAATVVLRNAAFSVRSPYTSPISLGNGLFITSLEMRVPTYLPVDGLCIVAFLFFALRNRRLKRSHSN